MSIPQDPFILLSYINTKLRDEYPNLEDLCQSLDIDCKELETVLTKIDYTYVPALNRFTASM